MDIWKNARTPIILAVALLILYLLFGFTRARDPTPPPAAPETEPSAAAESADRAMQAYERHYETMLEGVLEQVPGVGNVIVMVNLDATEARVYEKNTRTSRQETVETDAQGGKRTIDDQSIEEEVVRVSGNGKEAPVVIKTLKPQVRGVVVVAEGAENATIRGWITDIVSRSLDVPPHRVAVVPKKHDR